MINVRQKTQAEIEQQEADYRFGAALVKGIPLKVCKTYLTKKDGSRVDTRDLTEEEILGLIHNDLIDFSSAQGSYKTTGRIGLDTFKLIEALKENGYTLSVNAVLQLSQMEQQFGHIVMDVMGSFGTAHFDKARTIAQFQKESSGDYSQVQTDEVMAVLEQMAVNEKNRKSSKRR